MKNQEIWYDKERLLLDADMEQVAQFIGMSTEAKGKNIGILCPDPNHNGVGDRHLGSCFIREDNTFICYSCGASGDVFKMVMLFKGVDYAEAKAIVGDACGGREHYRISGSQTKKDYPRILNKEECERIGIYNKRVYGVERLSYERRSLQPGERAVLSHWDEDDEVVYCIERCLETNPLLKLMRENFSLYRELVTNKAAEQIEGYLDMMMAFADGPDGAGLVEAFSHLIAQVEDVVLDHFKDEKSVYQVLEFSRALKKRKLEAMASLTCGQAAAAF